MNTRSHVNFLPFRVFPTRVCRWDNRRRGSNRAGHWFAVRTLGQTMREQFEWT